MDPAVPTTRIPPPSPPPRFQSEWKSLPEATKRVYYEQSPIVYGRLGPGDRALEAEQARTSPFYNSGQPSSSQQGVSQIPTTEPSAAPPLSVSGGSSATAPPSRAPKVKGLHTFGATTPMSTVKPQASSTVQPSAPAPPTAPGNPFASGTPSRAPKAKVLHQFGATTPMPTAKPQASFTVQPSALTPPTAPGDPFASGTPSRAPKAKVLHQFGATTPMLTAKPQPSSTLQSSTSAPPTAPGYPSASATPSGAPKSMFREATPPVPQAAQQGHPTQAPTGPPPTVPDGLSTTVAPSKASLRADTGERSTMQLAAPPKTITQSFTEPPSTSPPTVARTAATASAAAPSSTAQPTAAENTTAKELAAEATAESCAGLTGLWRITDQVRQKGEVGYQSEGYTTLLQAIKTRFSDEADTLLQECLDELPKSMGQDVDAGLKRTAKEMVKLIERNIRLSFVVAALEHEPQVIEMIRQEQIPLVQDELRKEWEPKIRAKLQDEIAEEKKGLSPRASEQATGIVVEDAQGRATSKRNATQDLAEEKSDRDSEVRKRRQQEMSMRSDQRKQEAHELDPIIEKDNRRSTAPPAQLNYEHDSRLANLNQESKKERLQHKYDTSNSRDADVRQHGSGTFHGPTMQVHAPSVPNVYTDDHSFRSKMNEYPRDMHSLATQPHTSAARTIDNVTPEDSSDEEGKSDSEDGANDERFLSRKLTSRSHLSNFMDNKGNPTYPVQDTVENGTEEYLLSPVRKPRIRRHSGYDTDENEAMIDRRLNGSSPTIDETEDEDDVDNAMPKFSANDAAFHVVDEGNNEHSASLKGASNVAHGTERALYDESAGNSPDTSSEDQHNFRDNHSSKRRRKHSDDRGSASRRSKRVKTEERQGTDEPLYDISAYMRHSNEAAQGHGPYQAVDTAVQQGNAEDWNDIDAALQSHSPNTHFEANASNTLAQGRDQGRNVDSVGKRGQLSAANENVGATDHAQLSSRDDSGISDAAGKEFAKTKAVAKSKTKVKMSAGAQTVRETRAAAAARLNDAAQPNPTVNRGRGRPRKSAINETIKTEAHDIFPAASTTPAATRGRGRPRKADESSKTIETGVKNGRVTKAKPAAAADKKATKNSRGQTEKTKAKVKAEKEEDEMMDVEEEGRGRGAVSRPSRNSKLRPRR